MTFWLAVAAVFGGIIYFGWRSDRKHGPRRRGPNADRNTAVDVAAAQRSATASQHGRGLMP